MKIKGGSKKRTKKIKSEKFSKDHLRFGDILIHGNKNADGIFNVNYSHLIDDNGVKFDQEKVKMQLLDPTFLEEVAKVFTFGAEKYGENNYKKGLHVSRCLGALDRHLKSFKVLEDNDPETGLSHLAHAACCLQMIYYNYKNKQEFDDRQSTFK